MKLRLRYYWDRLRTSYWFVPSLMLIAAVALSRAAVGLDTQLGERTLVLGWGYPGDSQGASAVLSTIAGSMITIAGVVFSITLVALSLASSQFGPRMLRNFIRDRVNQAALGAFLATFLYCLLVLRTVRHGPEDGFVPHLAVTLGVVLAVASIAMLIFYIHHVATHIQADTLIDAIYAELGSLMDRLYPQAIGERADAGSPEVPLALGTPHGFDQPAATVYAECDDYLQAVDGEALMAVAAAHDLVVRVERRPGDYALCGARLMSVWPAERLEPEMAESLRACMVFGAQRTATQDIEFAIDQLVEIAARALSPGINDPFTAIACVDRLGSALARLAQRALPSTLRADQNGRPRIIAAPVSFTDAIDTAFNPIRQCAGNSAAVTIRLLEVLAEIEPLASRSEDRAALRRHALMLMRSAETGLAEHDDREDVRRRYLPLLSALAPGKAG